ncbi:MAG: SDR family oxidoreductase [Actinomycetota bacterium]|jgi:3-oxoacyl-[acyl-carrier protein] reductase|nr:SDR family oxidoreductase [Actinomycetota bacterium]
MSVDSKKLRLEGKAALITGAGSGIGRAASLLFASEGAEVACADLIPEAAEETVAKIRSEGGKAVSIQVDVRLANDAERMVSSAIKAFRHLDILFNNAGTGIRGMVHELDEEQWDTVIDINLKGVYQCSKAAIPIFLEQNSGNIINTASTFGLLASPRYAAYCASKGGVIMLTKQMALDYGPDIRVNCICPGATDTPRLRRNMSVRPDPVAYEQQLSALNRAAGRLADPKEIAYAALFLASDESSFVTGSALVVDGGQTIDA